MQGTDRSAVEAEAELQRDLARKLGIAKKRQKGKLEAADLGKQILMRLVQKLPAGGTVCIIWQNTSRSVPRSLHSQREMRRRVKARIK